MYIVFQALRADFNKKIPIIRHFVPIGYHSYNVAKRYFSLTVFCVRVIILYSIKVFNTILKKGAILCIVKIAVNK